MCWREGRKMKEKELKSRISKDSKTAGVTKNEIGKRRQKHLLLKKKARKYIHMYVQIFDI
jgi:hypothetical protein